MKLIKQSKWQKAYDLRGNVIYVRTTILQRKDGSTYSTREAVRHKVA